MDAEELAVHRSRKVKLSVYKDGTVVVGQPRGTRTIFSTHNRAAALTLQRWFCVLARDGSGRHRLPYVTELELDELDGLSEQFAARYRPENDPLRTRGKGRR